MVTLPGISTYTADQLARAQLASPALARYLRLLNSNDLDDLHRLRHRGWCECVLATYFELADTRTICAYWSQIGDEILSEAWRASGLLETEATLFAFGKHGAKELNLSSDIDVMVIANLGEGPAVEKMLRTFRARIETGGEFGFCFRLDFDLRPGGTVGPLVTTPAQFQDHYWTQGETWERLALVRLRPIAGNAGIARQIGDIAARFSYRKFLDFTLLEDLKALRAQVHQKGFVRRPSELNLKLEIGGIRDIELFTHSLLVLHAGKLPELRTRLTGEALEKLGARGILPLPEVRSLIDDYWFLRAQENRVQSIEDRQTHVLSDPAPASVPGLLTGPELQPCLQRVDQIVSTLLGQVVLEAVHLAPTLASQHAWLSELGFKEFAAWDLLIRATALSGRSERDERARHQFLFTFTEELARHPDRDHGLHLLYDFVRHSRGKAPLFTMLLRSPRLLEDLARLFGLSPYLGSILAARPELLDHFVLRSDEAWSEDPAQVAQQMSERKLLTEIWSANTFLTDHNLKSLTESITQTADAIVSELLRQLKKEFAGATLEILCLGKWGGRELGLRSDLDFIFVTPTAPSEDDFKVARRLISRLNYEVDLRLRPSGQSGPLLVARDRLHEYWRDEAQPWERQAYLRARALSPGLIVERQILFARNLSAAERIQLAEIRRKLLKPLDDQILDLKYSEGGLIDIEFAAQIALLARAQNTHVTATEDMLSALSWSPELSETYLFLRQIEQLLHLASASKTGALPFDHPDFVKVSHLAGLGAPELRLKILSCLKKGKLQLQPQTG